MNYYLYLQQSRGNKIKGGVKELESKLEGGRVPAGGGEVSIYTVARPFQGKPDPNPDKENMDCQVTFKLTEEELRMLLLRRQSFRKRRAIDRARRTARRPSIPFRPRSTFRPRSPSCPPPGPSYEPSFAPKAAIMG